MMLLNDLYNICCCEEIDGGLNYSIKLNPNHFIFKAHFPNNPITPGVCILQIVEELLEKHFKCGITLDMVKNIKFLSVISPNVDNCIQYRFSTITHEGNTINAKVNVLSGSHLFAKISASYHIC